MSCERLAVVNSQIREVEIVGSETVILSLRLTVSCELLILKRKEITIRTITITITITKTIDYSYYDYNILQL